MIITENMLAPYRGKQGFANIDGRTGGGRMLAPDAWFEDTEELFENLWRAPGAPQSSMTVTLILGFIASVPRLNPAFEWRGYIHKSGSYSCRYTRVIGTILQPRASIAPHLNKIASEFYYAEKGHFDRQQMLASLLVRYVNLLAEVKLDCEGTWRYLEEAIYPIDATQDNLDCLVDDAPRIRNLADWGDYPPVRYSPSPALFLLTENSD